MMCDIRLGGVILNQRRQRQRAKKRIAMYDEKLCTSGLLGYQDPTAQKAIRNLNIKVAKK